MRIVAMLISAALAAAAPVWAEPAPRASEASIRLLALWELDKLDEALSQKGKPKKIASDSLKGYPSITTILAKLGLSGDIDTVALRDRVRELDETDVRLLSSFLRIQARNAARDTEPGENKPPTEKEKRKVLTESVAEELKRLGSEGSLKLSPSVKNKLLELEGPEDPKNPRLDTFDGERIQKILKSDLAEKLSPDELLQLMADLRGNAFDRLGNEFFSGSTAELPGEPGRLFHQLNQERQAIPKAGRRFEERPSTTPQQRFRPASPSQGIAPQPRRIAPGRVEFGQKPKKQDRFFAAAPEFSAKEDTSFQSAVSPKGRESLAMETGSIFVNPVTGQKTFAPAGLCQATPIARTYGADGRSCSFVFGSAKHCFEGNEDAIRLDGFAVLGKDQFRVLQSSNASGEDFAMFKANGPCSSKLEPVELAPKGELDSGLLALDVHRHGKKVLQGKAFQSQDSGFVGINAIGEGEIIPGDSGGGAYVIRRAADGSMKKYYAGALSAKYVDGAFRDGVGIIARTPDWAYEELPNLLAEPLPAEGLLSRNTSQPNETRTH